MAKSGGGPVLGVDIGTSLIKAVEVRSGRAGAQVTGVAVMPTPPETFAGDVISNPSALGAALKRLLSDNGIGAKQVVSTASAQTSFVIKVLPDIPRMTDKELTEMMKYEVERQVPFPAAEVISDYRPLLRGDEPPEATSMSVLLVAGRQNMIDAHVQTLMAAGLQPLAIDVEMLATARTILSNGAARPEETVAIVNIGAVKTDIALFDRGVLVLPRTVFVAGDNFSRAISDALDQPIEQAERLKKELGEVQAEHAANYGQFAGFGEAPSQDFGVAPGADAAASSSDIPPASEPHDLGAQPTSLFTLDDEPAPPVTRFSLEDDEPAAPASRFTLEDEPAAGAPRFQLEEAPPPPARPALSMEPEPPTAAPVPPGASVAPVSSDDVLRSQISQALAPVVGELATELRRSIDFHRSRSEDAGVHRVILCGGSAQLRGLAAALQSDLGIPVEVFSPSPTFGLAAKNVSPAYFSEIGPLLSVGLGLAIRDAVPDSASVKPVAPPKPNRKVKAK